MGSPVEAYVQRIFNTSLASCFTQLDNLFNTVCYAGRTACWLCKSWIISQEVSCVYLRTKLVPRNDPMKTIMDQNSKSIWISIGNGPVMSSQNNVCFHREMWKRLLSCLEAQNTALPGSTSNLQQYCCLFTEVEWANQWVAFAHTYSRGVILLFIYGSAIRISINASVLYTRVHNIRAQINIHCASIFACIEFLSTYLWIEDSSADREKTKLWWPAISSMQVS